MLKNNFIYKIISYDLKKNKYKEIITRFPPEPNGFLHIGHVKSICINFGIIKYFNGKCILRLDDTNPKTEKKIYVNKIKKDIKWLGFKWYKKEKYSSDYFEIYYNYAIELIKKNLAYVDELSLEKIKKYRGNLKIHGKNSPFRNRNIYENLYIFNKMKQGFFKEGTKCLRAKINMKSNNIILRDPILYRIKKNKHFKTKNKWKIYPTYDFSQCIADSIEKITHSICTLEFQNNKILYNWILNNISVNHIPKQYEFSRLNITNTLTSKRKIKKLIKKKIINNWDDPRLLTISGMRNRGYTPKSIKNFCYSLGISKQESNINISILEDFLRKELNNKSKRIMAVINPIKIKINNLNKEIKIKIPNHPQKKEMGEREIILHSKIYIDKKDFNEKKKNKLFLGRIVKLRYAGLIKAEKIIKDKNKNIIYIECKYMNYIYKKKKQKINIIHWVSEKNSFKTKFKLFDYLFKCKNPNKEKNFISKINKKSLIIKKGLIEKYAKKAKKNQVFQFEREGYFKININIKNNKKKITFNHIVSLKK